MADVTTVSADVIDSSKNALLDSFSQARDQLVHIVPKILAMGTVLVLGYIIARLVAHAAGVVAEKIGLQTAAERSGLADSMRHVGIRRNVPAIVGTMVFWLLMCVFLMAAFNILDLPSLTNAMAGVVNYIPHLLVATVVVVFGLLAATFVRGIVATSARSRGHLLCRASGQRLLLCVDGADLHRRLQSLGNPICPARKPDHDHLRRSGLGLWLVVRPGRP